MTRGHRQCPVPAERQRWPGGGVTLSALRSLHSEFSSQVVKNKGVVEGDKSPAWTDGASAGCCLDGLSPRREDAPPWKWASACGGRPPVTRCWAAGRWFGSSHRRGLGRSLHFAGGCGKGSEDGKAWALTPDDTLTCLSQTPGRSPSPSRPHRKDCQKNEPREGGREERKAPAQVVRGERTRRLAPPLSAHRGRSSPRGCPVPWPRCFASLGSSWRRTGPPHGVAPRSRPPVASRARDSWWPQA